MSQKSIFIMVVSKLFKQMLVTKYPNIARSVIFASTTLQIASTMKQTTSMIMNVVPMPPVPLPINRSKMLLVPPAVSEV